VECTYASYELLFIKSSEPWLRTSVKEMMDSNIPANKIVIGKPASRIDYDSHLNTGYIDP